MSHCDGCFHTNHLRALWQEYSLLLELERRAHDHLRKLLLAPPCRHTCPTSSTPPSQNGPAVPPEHTCTGKPSPTKKRRLPNTDTPATQPFVGGLPGTKLNSPLKVSSKTASTPIRIELGSTSNAWTVMEPSASSAKDTEKTSVSAISSIPQATVTPTQTTAPAGHAKRGRSEPATDLKSDNLELLANVAPLPYPQTRVYAPPSLLLPPVPPQQPQKWFPWQGPLPG